MKVIKLPENFYDILGLMEVNDWFQMPNGDKFKLHVIKSIPQIGVKILTFEFNNEDYMCNVWHNDVFYFQKV
jgi:hypothetical protein